MDPSPIHGVSCWLRGLYFACFWRGEDMNHWIDLLIVIPSWLGVFAVIAAMVVTGVAG